jgi:hypothetical protein
MFKALAVTCVALALGACATPSGNKTAAAPAEPVREQMAVSNNSPFDLAACEQPKREFEPESEESVMGALLTRGPAFQECFLDPKSAQGSPTDVTVKATIAASGVTVSVGGTGLSEGGKACLEAAAKAIVFTALPAGAPEVSGQVPVAVSVKPIEWGTNVVNDAAGTVRLGLPTTCSCFAEQASSAPPQPVLKLKLTTAAPPDITIDGVAKTPEVGTCLGEKLKALELPKSDLEMGLPLILVNGWADEADATASAPLQFQQLEAIRGRRTAEVLIAAGHRGQAAARYDAVVKKYKAKPTYSLIGELRTKCAAVLATDDAHLTALKALVGVYEAEAKLVAAEKAKEPAWAKIEPSLTAQLGQTSGEVQRVEQQKVSDTAACPKNK